MQKVTVSHETSDRKRNQRMPKKGGFLAPLRNSLIKLTTAERTCFSLLLLLERARVGLI